MSTFNETIEKLKTEIDAHITTLKSQAAWAEVEKLYRALGTIEELVGAPKSTLAELFGFGDAGSSVSVLPGEFMGMDAVAAAKTYMEKKKAVASTLDEIMEALQKGGAGQVQRDGLRTSLARSTWDVQKAPGQDLYTLVKFLPHVKRGAKGKKSGQTEEPEPVAETSAAEKGAGA